MGLWQNPSALWRLVFSNSRLTSLNWISKVGNITVLIYTVQQCRYARVPIRNRGSLYVNHGTTKQNFQNLANSTEISSWLWSFMWYGKCKETKEQRNDNIDQQNENEQVSRFDKPGSICCLLRAQHEYPIHNGRFLY